MAAVSAVPRGLAGIGAFVARGRRSRLKSYFDFRHRDARAGASAVSRLGHNVARGGYPFVARKRRAVRSALRGRQRGQLGRGARSLGYLCRPAFGMLGPLSCIDRLMLPPLPHSRRQSIPTRSVLFVPRGSRRSMGRFLSIITERRQAVLGQRAGANGLVGALVRGAEDGQALNGANSSTPSVREGHRSIRQV